MQGHLIDINIFKEDSTSTCRVFYLEDGSSRYLYGVMFYKTVISNSHSNENLRYVYCVNLPKHKFLLYCKICIFLPWKKQTMETLSRKQMRKPDAIYLQYLDKLTLKNHINLPVIHIVHLNICHIPPFHQTQGFWYHQLRIHMLHIQEECLLLLQEQTIDLLLLQ